MMQQGEIYCLISPSGKKYVGQCVQTLSNGKEWGHMKRWRQHIGDARNGKDYCRLLNNAIRKYGPDTFKIELLTVCDIDELDKYENMYIQKLNTMTPHGYNLVSGRSNSRQSQETKEKRRQSMLGKNAGRVLDKRQRIRAEDNELPKYLRYYRDSSGKEGYRVSHHPSLVEKSFLGKYLSLDDKLQKALCYLNSADMRQRFNE